MIPLGPEPAVSRYEEAGEAVSIGRSPNARQHHHGDHRAGLQARRLDRRPDRERRRHPNRFDRIGYIADFETNPQTWARVRSFRRQASACAYRHARHHEEGHGDRRDPGDGARRSHQAGIRDLLAGRSDYIASSASRRFSRACSASTTPTRRTAPPTTPTRRRLRGSTPRRNGLIDPHGTLEKGSACSAASSTPISGFPVAMMADTIVVPFAKRSCAALRPARTSRSRTNLADQRDLAVEPYANQFNGSGILECLGEQDSARLGSHQVQANKNWIVSDTRKSFSSTARTGRSPRPAGAPTAQADR